MVRAHAIALGLCIAGCNLVFGVDEPELSPGAGGAAQSSGNASNTVTTTGAQGGMSASSASNGGSGGQGGVINCTDAAITDPSNCYYCCTVMHQGQVEFENGFRSCGCTNSIGGCDMACGVSVCDAAQGVKPDDDCVTCIVTNLNDPGSGCNITVEWCGTPACSEFKACVLACSTG